MFTRLRNRFLVLNLVIISVMMLAAFAAIYAITYQNAHRDINMELNKVSDFLHSPDGGGGQGKPHRGGDKGGPPMFDNGMGPPAERSVSFSLQTDVHWAVTATNSRFEMDEDFYTDAIAKVSSSKENNGQFTLDGNRWAYKVDSTPNGYSVVFLDVTAQLKILTTLVYTFLIVGLVMLVVIYFTSRFFANRSIAPVREAFIRQKQFIADASHELKTPLAVINTNADVLLANTEDTIAQQAKWLHHIKSETERMKTLTNDLLYLTEMDDARMQMIMTPVNLSDAVEGVLLTMEAVIFEKDIALSYDIEPELTVRGNSEQLVQVIMILMDNAIKYTHAGGSITLSLRKKHNDALLTVTNTGQGIAPEHLERIFDRFYRVDASRSRQMGGHGLGLAIAKSIVEQHSGRIAAKSTHGESATFTVQLPLGA